jgi:P27 family predicted phage terminase small subunit
MPQRRNAPELKLLYGVDPNERERAPKPTPARREPDMPEQLSDRERTLWRLVVDELRDMGQLAAADTHEIAGYVRAVALAERIKAELDESSGMSSLNADTGVRHAHPLIAAYDRVLGRAHGLATGLGLNPHGRSLIVGKQAVPVATEQAVVRDLYA